MAKAMRPILSERGHDPRDFVLMAFGGAGGLHAGALMREMNIPRAVVPNNPGALSAIGMLATDFRHDRSRTLARPIDVADPAEIQAVFQDLESDVLDALGGEGIDRQDSDVLRSADLRYIGQEYHLNVPCPAGEVEPPALAKQFNEAHEAVYGYATPEFPVELVNLRIVGVGRTERPSLPEYGRRNGDGASPIRARRPVYFEETGFTETPIYETGSLFPGDVVQGPAIIEDPRSTVAILPGQVGTIDELRNVFISDTPE
jgi:N-methylhydantoinase A